MTAEQERYETIDISKTLRSIMAVRRLTVSDMARMAGVSKRAMDNYLAGPSKPRATAIASLAKALELSADTILFGELDVNGEAAYQAAFNTFVKLMRDLKSDPDLSKRFLDFEPGSEAFNDFVMSLAFERAGAFRRQFAATRREGKIVFL
ncbi:hypothetical protein DSD19_03825 [Rhodovulum sp. BSW8]|uniref:helix-turn-helix domain-containing protein n=1 Tax=Rhodovulum sp. BSW8 TaxID=2259645 RepID=UPI000DE201C3|nr:helix-turn-helix transcriptional regulator [Rhodovulum sp. BSW8]RBO54521.1 hypothetical protein DSD19_03825 [Rhodovulum sp. BSW8]